MLKNTSRGLTFGRQDYQQLMDQLEGLNRSVQQLMFATSIAQINNPSLFEVNEKVKEVFMKEQAKDSQGESKDKGGSSDRTYITPEVTPEVTPERYPETAPIDKPSNENQ